MKEVIEDTLGPEVEELTDPDKKNVPRLETEEKETGHRKQYASQDGWKLRQIPGLGDTLATQSKGKPILEQMIKSITILQRDEVIRAHAQAQKLVEPSLPQKKDVDDFLTKAMPAADVQATAVAKRVAEVTSPKKDNRFQYKRKRDTWEHGGRGTKTGSHGNKKPHAAPAATGEDRAKPKGRGAGRGYLGKKPWPKGKGRGKKGG